MKMPNMIYALEIIGSPFYIPGTNITSQPINSSAREWLKKIKEYDKDLKKLPKTDQLLQLAASIYLDAISSGNGQDVGKDFEKVVTVFTEAAKNRDSREYLGRSCIDFIRKYKSQILDEIKKDNSVIDQYVESVKEELRRNFTYQEFCDLAFNKM